MALIVEDGSGVDGANTYASEADCIAYHAGRLNTSAWDNASGPNKEKALRMATGVIDANIDFGGRKVEADQALEWPRHEVENEDGEMTEMAILFSITPGPYYPSDEIPARLVKATCELARELLAKDRLAAMEPAQTGVKSIGVGQGAVKIDFDSAEIPGVFTSEVLNLLRPLGTERGGSLMRPCFRVE